MPSASATERGTPTGAACAVAQADGQRARFWAVLGGEGASHPRRDEKSGRLWTAAARVAPPTRRRKQMAGKERGGGTRYKSIAEDIGFDATGKSTKVNELDEIGAELARFIKAESRVEG